MYGPADGRQQGPLLTWTDGQLVPTSLHILMAGIVLFLTFFQFESPRFLIRQGKVEQASHVMSHLRRLPEDHPYIRREMYNIQASLNEELEATKGTSFLGMVREMVLMPKNFYPFYLTTMVQLLSQWSGAGSITLYAPDLFKILGVTGQEQRLLVTAIFGVVKLVGSIICTLFLVDVIGRKRSLLIGITLQAVSMLYVASFLTATPRLGVDEDYNLPGNEMGASRGAIGRHPVPLCRVLQFQLTRQNKTAMIYVSGFGWALGWNSMQYLLTAELFPLRIRALATSWAMTLHFANQYGNSRAVPNMLLPHGHGGISPAGTFWSFAAITVAGGLWVLVSVPETAGRGLESMGRLFELPWYRIGLRGNEDAEQRDREYEEKMEAAAGVELELVSTSCRV
jgi:hypothetical protein